jgi:hypothetical protein
MTVLALPFRDGTPIASAERAALIKAHAHAEDFHAAMGRALGAQADIEDLVDWCRRHPAENDAQAAREKADFEKRYRDALGAAAAALGKMPPAWATVLGAKACEAPVIAEAAE